MGFVERPASEKERLLKRFGARVRKLREENDLTQEELGFTAELDRTYISSIERGERNVSLFNICKVAIALNISPSELLEGI